MAVPDALLPHTVVRVDPAVTTTGYNDQRFDYGPAATRTTIKAWLQQDQRLEQFRDSRDPLDEKWLLVSGDSGGTGRSRFEWADHPRGPVVFEVDGPPEPVYTPAGFHHTEAQLRIVAG